MISRNKFIFLVFLLLDWWIPAFAMDSGGSSPKGEDDPVAQLVAGSYNARLRAEFERRLTFTLTLLRHQNDTLALEVKRLRRKIRELQKFIRPRKDNLDSFYGYELPLALEKGRLSVANRRLSKQVQSLKRNGVVRGKEIWRLKRNVARLKTQNGHLRQKNEELLRENRRLERRVASLKAVGYPPAEGSSLSCISDDDLKVIEGFIEEKKDHEKGLSLLLYALGQECTGRIGNIKDEVERLKNWFLTYMAGREAGGRQGSVDGIERHLLVFRETIETSLREVSHLVNSICHSLAANNSVDDQIRTSLRILLERLKRRG